MSTLYLLVGRGGSRGVPGKNLRQIGGASLVEWKIRAVRAHDPRAWIVCSSDSGEIRAEALACGADLTIERPAELASDTATTASVVKHALSVVGGEYERVFLLEPSTPYTLPEHYSEALAMMATEDADLVVAMKRTEPHTAFIGDIRADASVTPIIVQFQRMARRRQDFAPQWTPSGSLYLFRRKMFDETGDIYGGARNYGLQVDRYTGHEIDTPHDLELAEWYYASGKVAMPYRGNARPYAIVGA